MPRRAAQRKDKAKAKAKDEERTEKEQGEQQKHEHEQKEQKHDKSATTPTNDESTDENQNDENKANSTSESSSVSTHLLFCGSSQWDLIGRKTVPKAVLDRGGSDAGEEILAPTRVDFVDHPGFRIKSAWSGPCASHAILLPESGEVYGIGRNDDAQLGVADLVSRWAPIKLELPDGERAVSASCGRSSTLIVTESGSCYGVGSNAVGQLGIGFVGAGHGSSTAGANNDSTKASKGKNKTTAGSKLTFVTKLTRVLVPSHEKVIGAAAAPDFSLFVCQSGAVYSAGSAENYQLGNGRTGQYMERANCITFLREPTPIRIYFIHRPSLLNSTPTNGAEDAVTDKKEVEIKAVAAGSCHSLALDTDGKVWSWGFGGYGRLGHKTTADEKLPRVIEFFDVPHLKVDLITCGQASSMAAQTQRKSLYTWGIMKRSGECNMYPKPVYDLFGHPVHEVRAGFSSVVLATEKSVVAWGPSPTHGELGFGKGNPKSSSQPKIVHAVDELYCKSIAEGSHFTFLVVDVDEGNDEEKSVFDRLDSLELSNVEKPQTSAKKKAGDKRKNDTSNDTNAGRSTSKGAKGRKKKRTK